MDITKLKEKLGDDFAALHDYVEELKTKHTQAVNESVTGRKNLKSRVVEMEAAQAKLLDRLGLDSLEDIDNLPDAKGQAEALKQFDTKFKRMEKELSDKTDALNTTQQRYRHAQLHSELSKALQAHDFVNVDVVGHYAAKDIEWDGDTPFYKDESGKLLNLADGVKHLASKMPELLKSKGAGGSGFGLNGESGQGQKNPWSKEHYNMTEQISLNIDNLTLAAQLKVAAGQ